MYKYTCTVHVQVPILITDGHTQCDNSMYLHVQFMGKVDYLLLRMEKELLQGLEGRGGWSGGLCGVVSWHDDMEEQDDFSKVQLPYIHVHVHGRRPRDTTMSMQQEDSTAVAAWVGCIAVMVELLATELLCNKAVQLASSHDPCK